MDFAQARNVQAMLCPCTAIVCQITVLSRFFLVHVQTWQVILVLKPIRGKYWAGNHGRSYQLPGQGSYSGVAGQAGLRQAEAPGSSLPTPGGQAAPFA